jgi:hypothetical protein
MQSYYLIKRIKKSHHDESILTKSDDLIKKYKSEYVYLFSLINEFNENPKDTFEYLSHRSIDKNIHYLIPDMVDCERARKFMH